MTDWEEGVKCGIAEMIGKKDKHNALILAIDNFLKAASEVGFTGLVIDELQATKAMLQSDIQELNEQIEKQKA